MSKRNLTSLTRRDGDRIIPVRQPPAQREHVVTVSGQAATTLRMCPKGCLPPSKFGNCPRCGRKLT